MELKKKTIESPNYSIVVPGRCNAACNFCFWDRNVDLSPMYLPNLRESLGNMPPQFHQISITGGEPTLSHLLADVLTTIDTDKYNHVVFTTNGKNILPFADYLQRLGAHINISRHAIGDERNATIFKSDSVPKAKDLEKICEELNNRGIDVTFNAVLAGGIKTKNDVLDYIKFAKDSGASAVCFRKRHGTLTPTPLERGFDQIQSREYKCPVCRSKTQIIKGMKTIWKASVEEPSVNLGMVYEVIYHPDGRLTEDWAGKKEVEFKGKPQKNKQDHRVVEVDHGTGNCGHC
ncbi:MAG: radical SAM protein [archaeon]